MEWKIKNRIFISPKLNIEQISESSNNTTKPTQNPEKKMSRNIVKRTIVLIICFIAAGFVIWYYGENGIIPATVVSLLIMVLYMPTFNYTMTQTTQSNWNTYITSLAKLKNSKEKWVLENQIFHSDVRRHYGTIRSVFRKPLKIKLIKPKHLSGMLVRSNVPTVLLKSSFFSILFLPNGIYVRKGLKKTILSYNDLQLTSSLTDFVENEKVANDARIIRYTWKFVNKNGSPDRRFAGNVQLPVCRYGQLIIKGAGMWIEILTTDYTLTSPIITCYSRYYTRLNASHIKYGVNPAFFKREKQRKRRPRFHKKENVSQKDTLLAELNTKMQNMGHNTYEALLNKKLFHKVQFVDSQIYDKHAIFLFKTQRDITGYGMFLEEIEKELNFSSGQKTVIEVVNENSFIIHFYSNELKNVENDLPLSPLIRQALDEIENRNPKKMLFESFPEINDDLKNEKNDFFSDRAKLSSEEPDRIPDSDSETTDKATEKLDIKEEKTYTPTDAIADLLSYFEEE